MRHGISAYRRQFVRALGSAAFAAALPRRLEAKLVLGGSTFTFTELENRVDDRIHVADGHRADVLIRFGDPILADAPAFRHDHLRARDQARQFGYGNDFTAFLPLPFGSSSSDRGLLCVNHETTLPSLMWPGVDRLKLTEEQVAVEMAAQGHSVVEIARSDDGRFVPVPGGRYNRRLDASTENELTGPAAGDDRLKTNADPSGTRARGTFAVCAGGVTPWGTVLLAEENFHKHFMGDFAQSPEARNFKRHSFDLEKETEYCWALHHDRFDVDKEPNESYRFGWVVEFDPYDAHCHPKKRSALGRFKHEGASVALNDDGRVVVYSGDDDRFEYLYKFVSNGRFDPDDRDRNRELLESGTLFVARFDDDGTGRWIPLVFGTNGLTPANEFASQAEVLIEARRAGDVLGATPLDRPEDVEANPVTGRVYVNLTNNRKRRASQVDAVNPRGPNPHGHILELTPPGGKRGGRDHAALDFRWEIFLQAGDPGDPLQRARYHAGTSANGWFSAPDNFAFDQRGRMWLTTDQGEYQKGNGIPDGLRVCDTEGEGRALTRLFFTCPYGAELCGPCFTPDDRTLFVAVQHPGEDDHFDRDARSTYEDPSTRWPDFDPAKPPRPAVVQITREDGDPIGG